MRKSLLILSAAFFSLAPALFAPTPSVAEVGVLSTLSDAQRAEVESIIHDYLTNKHPEVIAQSIQTMQQRERETSEAKSKSEVLKSKQRLYADPHTPVTGNPKGDVIVVEFYDYQCGYCKMAHEGVERLLKEDKNVKFVHKDFPILGPVSTEASKAALASVKQGKFEAYYNALMSKKDHLTSDMVYQIAKDVGLDSEKLKKDMNSSEINETISASLKLGQEVGVRGTPMFIINDNVFPGAMEYTQLKEAVAEARKNLEKKS